jgi:LPXTG-motif cell wall-anchored protein
MAIRRLLVGAVLGAVASVALPAAAAVADPTYPPSIGGLSVSASTVVAGGSVHVSGSGFKPGSEATVTVRIGGVVVNSFTVTVGSGGDIAATVVLAAAGTATIVVTGIDPSGATRVLTSVVLAASGSSGSASAGLPDTGASIGTPLLLGGALVLGGAGAILATRRRRRRGSAATG